MLHRAQGAQAVGTLYWLHARDSQAQVNCSLGSPLKQVTSVCEIITSGLLPGAQSSFPSLKVDHNPQGS